MQPLRTCSSGPFTPLQVMILEQMGWAVWPSAPGTATSQRPAMPVFCHASCKVWGAWGHSVPSTAWLWGQALLIATLILSPQPLSTVLDQEVPSLTLTLSDLHNGQLSPPGMGLKP